MFAPRGTKEIGGSCIELQSEHSRILIDFGLPLVDENMERFDSKKIKNRSKEDLIKLKVLPDISGLYKDEKPSFDAILLSHSHQDHFGLLSYVNPQIPVYLSEGCKELLDIAHFFNQTDYEHVNTQIVKKWISFEIGDFRITPYLVDHSAFDALAFHIEAENKIIFYSGDFRGHGRKNILFQNIIKRPIDNISYLILEGSMFGRVEGACQTEQELENHLVDLFDNDKERLYFIACSSQNIDRLVSIYRTCVKNNRIFVIDPYTAYILDKLKKISPRIPQFDWGGNIKIFFVPNAYTGKMAENKSLFKFKSAKITYEQMQANRNNLVVKDTYKTRWIFSKKKDLKKTSLIYSLWTGYLPDVRTFWEKNNVPILEIHCSGHAYVKDLKEFVRVTNPKYVIPIHTFYPEEYSDSLGCNVKIVKDGKSIKI